MFTSSHSICQKQLAQRRPGCCERGHVAAARMLAGAACMGSAGSMLCSDPASFSAVVAVSAAQGQAWAGQQPMRLHVDDEVGDGIVYVSQRGTQCMQDPHPKWPGPSGGSALTAAPAAHR